MCFFMMTFIFNVVTLIFYLLTESESKNMWSKFANVTPRMIHKKGKPMPMKKLYCYKKSLILVKTLFFLSLFYSQFLFNACLSLNMSRMFRMSLKFWKIFKSEPKCSFKLGFYLKNVLELW